MHTSKEARITLVIPAQTEEQNKELEGLESVGGWRKMTYSLYVYFLN